MSTYKRVETKNGREMYFVDGNMISAKLIPNEILARLPSEGEVTVPGTVKIQKPVKEVRKCIFDGEPGTNRKFLNEEAVWLCETHYKTMTSGKIAEQMRKNSEQITAST